MTIEYNQGEITSFATIVINGDDSLRNFKELVFRATNLWADAPPEIKEFADMAIHGMVLQNYKGQDTSPSRQVNRRFAHYHLCKQCNYVTAVWTMEDQVPNYPIHCDNQCVPVEPHPDDDPEKVTRYLPCGAMLPFNSFKGE